MTEKRALKRDSYLVVCDPMELSNGRFSARFVIHRGDKPSGEVVKRMDYPGEEFATPGEANTYAADASDRWLSENG